MRLALALLVVPFACAVDMEDGDDGWSEPGKSDDPSAGGVTSTRSADVRVLDGFNALLDATAGRCLEPSGTGPAYSIGAIEKPFELAYVSKKDDLARTLGIDAGLKIKYGPGTLSSAASFLDSFKPRRSATHLLVTARASYRVTNTRPVKLTTEAAEWLAQDPRTFLHRCGNFFVNGVELEAQLFVMIRLDALTEEAARTISADLGIAGATATLGLDGNVKGKLEQLAKREDITIEMNVLDRGFLVDGGTTALIASLLTTGLSADSFTKIDAVRAAMLASLNADACRDGGMGLATCTGDRPGYDANSVRNAVPVKVDLRSYARATNAPIGGPGSSYEVMRGLIERASRYLRALSRTAGRMETIATDEIGAFLAAPSQTGFALAPPAAPQTRLDALVALARGFRDRFDVARDGSVAAELDARLASCWASAQEGAFDACTGDGSPAADTAAAEAAIADYAATARIVPVQFAAKGVMSSSDAADACAVAGKRLPTFAEAQRLAIPIGYADLPRTSETRMRFSAWHSERSLCGGGQSPAFANDPNGTAGNICASESLLSPHPTTTLCVPPNGPFDRLPEL